MNDKTKKTIIRESLEKKHGDLTALIETMTSGDDDCIISIPSGMSLVEFWELANELEEC